MKKTILILAAVSIALTMSSCEKKTQGTDETIATSVAAEEINETVATSKAEEVTETVTNSDEKTTVLDELTPSTTEKKSEETKKTTVATTKKPVSKKIAVSDLRIGMKVTDDTVASLGSVVDKQSAPSCHFDGNDTIYCYNGFKIYTYADNGVQKLYLVEINGSSVKTAKGANVGMSVNQVKDIYGEPMQETGTALIYRENGANTRFTFNEGQTVTLIEFEEV